jgi:non-specific protein-tyrosine kinase
MELRDYLSVLARRRAMVIAVFAATLAAALAVALLQPAKWTAKATLRVQPSAALVGGTVQEDDVKYLDRLVNTYSRLATSREMGERVARELNLAEPPQISFAQIPNTNLVEVGVTTGERGRAAPTAKRVASLLIGEIETLAAADARAAEKSFARRTRELERDKARAQAELEQLEADPAVADRQRALELREDVRGTSQRLAVLRDDHERYQSTLEANARGVTRIAEPAEPMQPDNRNLKVTLALGLLLAAVVAPGMAFVAENLSRRFNTGEEIEASLDAPVLGTVPLVPGVSSRQLFNSGSPAEEAVRALRTLLLHNAPGSGDARTVLITSAHPGEGKSTVTANLGRSLALSGRSTALVDADLRAPVLHEIFGADREPGLGEILRDPQAWVHVALPTGVSNLELIPAGRPTDDPATLLGLPTTKAVFHALARRYEYVLVDSPALLAVTDALAIIENVDGVLLVAGLRVQRDVLRRAHQTLTRVGAPVLGVVVNGAAEPLMYGYGDYGRRSARGSTVG